MDKELLQEVYRRYSNELYLYLYSFCRNRAEAEDLMQEVFKRYREGTATEAEQTEIREEIEKYEQINDYLCEQLEWDSDGNLNGKIGARGSGRTDDRGGEAGPRRGEEQAEGFARMIQKAIRRAFLKFGLAMTAVFLVIVLFFQFGLSPLMDRFYYDPGELFGESANRLTLDLNVYGELHNLSIQGYDASVYGRGYGTYDIRINQTCSNL